jgi:hypothetical protein
MQEKSARCSEIRGIEKHTNEYNECLPVLLCLFYLTLLVQLLLKFGTGDVHKNSFRVMSFFKNLFGENHA